MRSNGTSNLVPRAADIRALERESVLEREDKKSNRLNCSHWKLQWKNNKILRTPMDLNSDQLAPLALMTVPTSMVLDLESEHQLWLLTTLRSSQDC